MKFLEKIHSPTTKKVLGIMWLIIASIYIFDRFYNQNEIRLLDWVAWSTMFIAGIINLIDRNSK